MSNTVSTILVSFAVFMGAVANIAAIGYGLYDWSTGVALATAAWTAFKLWLLLVATAIIAAILGIAIGVTK